jgi:hypothetical protein
MKVVTVCAILALVMIAAPAQAGIFNMDFANSTYDLGSGDYIGLSNQYSDYGLSFSHMSRYNGSLDPFDGYGICQGALLDFPLLIIVIVDPNYPPPPPPPPSMIYFDDATDFVEFDYFTTINDYSMQLIARDADGNAIGSFNGSNDGFGRIDAVGIKSIEFRGELYAGLSSLTYHRDELPAIPEPKSALLFGLGIIGIALARKSFQ